MRNASSIYRLRFLLVAMVVLWGAVAPTAQAAFTNDPAELATRVVTDVLRAQEDGDANAMYDLMAPESRNALPRQAFRAWLLKQPAAKSGSEVVVGSVKPTKWTYDATGERYSSVYEVTVTSPVSRTFHVIDDGGYKWFFEPDESLATIAQRGSAFTVEHTSAFRSPIYQQLDTFWAQIFADAGITYESPKDIKGITTTSTQTGCGGVKDIADYAAFYCPEDGTIYYDPAFRDVVVENVGEDAWINIMAHEWSHHIQMLLGQEVTKRPELAGGSYSVEMELQADCLAGIFAQDAIVRGTVDDSYVDESDVVMDVAGDPAGTAWNDPLAHGSAEERKQSWTLGYDSGFTGCALPLEAPAAKH